jgi:hypothetical protein
MASPTEFEKWRLHGISFHGLTKLLLMQRKCQYESFWTSFHAV